MDIYIDAYGSRLSCDKGMLLVEQEETATRLSAARVSSICMTTACSLTTDALVIASRHGIPLILVDRQGRPLGRWWQPTFGNPAAIRRGQFLMRDTKAGKAWMQRQLLRKADSQYELLHQLNIRKSKRGQHLPEAMEALKGYRKQLAEMSLGEEVQSFMQVEGNLSKAYFKAIGAYLPRPYAFVGRSRRPSKDAFNAVLNYLYGVLYKHAERALLLAGLDPHLGVWHSESRNQAALVYDFVEPERCWADWTAIQLFLRNQVNPDHFESREGGIWLTRSGRKLAVVSFQAFLRKKVQRNGKRRSRQIHLQLDAHQLASLMMQEYKNHTEDASPTHL